MRLQIVNSKNAASLYVVKSIYENGRRSSKIVEKLGTYADLHKRLNGEDPIVWAKKYVDLLTQKEKEERREVLVKYSPSKIINKDEQRSFNGGYLFLKKIYHELGLHNVFNPAVCHRKRAVSPQRVAAKIGYFPDSSLTPSVHWRLVRLYYWV